MEPFKAIIDLLNQHGIQYQLIKHQPVFTCEQAADVRGTTLHQGAKALLLKTNNYFVLAIMPGDKRLDSKKLKNYLHAKNLRFATPDEVKAQMGCEIGACYPFGSLINIRMIVDSGLSQNQQISFNPGVHNQSIIMKYSDFKSIVSPE
ncbi:hypothetical protein A3K55_00855, partial [Candidatus Shapirobacteria bacterium RBG_13_44_7]